MQNIVVYFLLLLLHLDIVDFIGCILDWSGQVEVLYLDEFESKN